MARHAARGASAWAGVALALALLLGACAGERGLGLPEAAAPPAAPRVTGVERVLSAEHRKLAAAFGGEYRLPEAERLLNDVIARVAAASDDPG